MKCTYCNAPVVFTDSGLKTFEDSELKRLQWFVALCEERIREQNDIPWWLAKEWLEIEKGLARMLGDTDIPESDAYEVVVDHELAGFLGASTMWTIQGPDGRKIGQSWADKELADDIAEHMSVAYEDGKARSK